jgi:predicted dehydrogenase
MTAARAIGIAGTSPAALAYAAGARSLGWDSDQPATVHANGVVFPAPLATTLAATDDLIAAGGQQAFGWPLITTSPVQELLRRFAAVGTVTALSSRSTRPMPPDAASVPAGVLFQSAHDHIALTLLVAHLTGMGAPVSVSASAAMGPGGIDDSTDVRIAFAGGITASVHADWHSDGVVSREFQLAGELGVLRSETDPRPALEFNGGPVVLPTKRLSDEQLRPLHESGIIDMMKTIGAGFDSGALPHAFTLSFGRDVLAVIMAAYQSIADRGPVTLPFDGNRNATPAAVLASS